MATHVRKELARMEEENPLERHVRWTLEHLPRLKTVTKYDYCQVFCPLPAFPSEDDIRAQATYLADLDLDELREQVRDHGQLVTCFANGKASQYRDAVEDATIARTLLAVGGRHGHRKEALRLVMPHDEVFRQTQRRHSYSGLRKHAHRAELVSDAVAVGQLTTRQAQWYQLSASATGAAS